LVEEEEGSAAEVVEWTEMGEWQVGGCPGMRGECGFELDRGRGSEIKWDNSPTVADPG
jgi:hypothetical protein